MSKVLLDLDTLLVRPRITIDGKSYEILAPDELTVLTSHRLGAAGKRMEELAAKPELDADEKEELSRVVGEISDTITSPIPADIRDKLRDPHRILIIQAFTMLLLTTKAGTVAAKVKTRTPAKKRIGEKPSRASSASTGARPAGGSAKRRSRS